MTFDEVIGQEECKQQLLQLVEKRRLPHAIMLCGQQGTGKLALATAFACHLLRSGDNTPANTEAMLAKLEHPDLHFTYPTVKLPSMGSDHMPVSADFAQEWHQLISSGLYFGIDDWLLAMGAENQQAIITAGESDELARKLCLKSSQGGFKVSIVWLPERMNGACANKLLKLLEEPPSQTVFLLVSEEPDKLLETIRSRVQRFDVKPLPEDTLCKALEQRRGLEQTMAARVARMAAGSWLRALRSLKAGAENEEFLNLFILLMRKAYMRDVKGLKAWSENAAAMGRERQRRFLAYFLHMVRESFVYNFKDERLNFMTLQEEAFTKNFARFVNENNILQLNDLANRSIREIGQNANPKIVFFDMALQMIILLIAK